MNASRLCLPCGIGDATYFLDMRAVQSVVRAEEIQASAAEAGQSQWIPFAGQHVPVLRSPALWARHPEALARRAVIVRSSTGYRGLLVESVSQVVEIPSNEFQPLPALMRSAAACGIAGVVIHGENCGLLWSPDYVAVPSSTTDMAAPLPVPRPKVSPPSQAQSGRRTRGLVVCPIDGDLRPGHPTALSLTSSQVLEILHVPRLIPVPACPAHLRGVVAWRGTVLPVMDASMRIGLRDQPSGNAERLVVVNGFEDSGPVGLLVSRGVRIVGLPLAHQPCTRGELLQFPVIRGAVDAAGETLLVPHLQRLLA